LAAWHRRVRFEKLMKFRGFAIVSLAYVVTSLVAGLVIRSLHLERDTTLALILAAIVSICAGAFLWHRDSPAASVSRVSTVLGAFLMALCALWALALHAVLRWFADPEIEISIAAIGTFVGTFLLLPTAWRNLVGPKSNSKRDDMPDG
jgi:hypothetical protein